MTIKVIKKNKVVDYTEPQKFAVMRKPGRRFYSDFRMVYETKEQAETQAVILANNNPESKFFVVELLGITLR